MCTCEFCVFVGISQSSLSHSTTHSETSHFVCKTPAPLYHSLSPSLHLSLAIAYRVIGKAGIKKGFEEGEGPFKKGKKLWEIFVLNYNKLKKQNTNPVNFRELDENLVIFSYRTIPR